MGLRSLLNRQTPAEPLTEPLTRLAELGRAEDPDEREGDHASSAAPPTHSTGLFAEQATRDRAAPISDVGVAKKVAQVSAAKQENTEPLDPRSWAAWKRGQSNSIAGLFDRRF